MSGVFFFAFVSTTFFFQNGKYWAVFIRGWLFELLAKFETNNTSSICHSVPTLRVFALCVGRCCIYHSPVTLSWHSI